MLGGSTVYEHLRTLRWRTKSSFRRLDALCEVAVLGHLYSQPIRILAYMLAHVLDSGLRWANAPPPAVRVALFRATEAGALTNAPGTSTNRGGGFCWFCSDTTAAHVPQWRGERKAYCCTAVYDSTVFYFFLQYSTVQAAKYETGLEECQADIQSKIENSGGVMLKLV